jgi:hypothetical protein
MENLPILLKIAQNICELKELESKVTPFCSVGTFEKMIHMALINSDVEQFKNELSKVNNWDQLREFYCHNGGDFSSAQRYKDNFDLILGYDPLGSILPI